MSDREGDRDPLGELYAELDRFVAERGWAPFHTPKNLVMALSAEVGELTEHFMWLDAARSDELTAAETAAVADEIADVLVYLLHLSRRLGVDPVAAARRKLVAAAAKYPVEAYRVPHRPATVPPGAPGGAHG